MGKAETPRWKTVARVGIVLGIVILVAGLIVRDLSVRASVQKDVLSLALIIIGGAATLTGIVLNWRELVGLLITRDTAEKANFAIVVLLVLALAGLLCYITNRRYSRMDWTGKRKYSLHSQTINFLSNVEQPVEAYFIHTDGIVPQIYNNMNDMLQEFQARAPRMKVERLNITAGLEVERRARELQQRLGTVSLDPPSVVFVMGDQHEVIPIGKLVEQRGGGRGMMPTIAFKGEGAFLNALMKLTEEEKPVVYALTGHGERPLETTGPAPSPQQPMPSRGNPGMTYSRLVQALESANYEVKPLHLATEGAVPDDCAVLLIAGPQTPIPEQEMGALHDYFGRRNGAAIVLADPELSETVNTNLDELVAAYGVELNTRAVGVTLMQTFMGAALTRSVPVGPGGMKSHPITEGLQNYTLHLEDACTLSVAPAGPQGQQGATELLTGPQQSWGETTLPLNQNTEYNEGEDTPKPAVVGALIEPQTPPQAPPGMEMPGPRIVVLGSSISFVNAILDQSPQNRYLLLNCVNWMAGKTQKLGIPPKTVDFNQVSIGKAWLAASRYLFLGAVPGLVIAMGVVVWLIRRR